MIQAYSLRLLETALNLALSLDETCKSQLAKLELKVIKICMTPLQWCFYIRFSQGRVELLGDYDGLPETTIYSSPLGLIRLSLLPASKARSLFHDGVRMEGDVQLGQELKRIMDSIDIDWEGHLSRFTGDMVAYKLGRGVRGMKHMVQHLQSSLSFQFTSYVQEEQALFPTREAIQDFCDDVGQLRLDVERLEAKIGLMKIGSLTS